MRSYAEGRRKAKGEEGQRLRKLSQPPGGEKWGFVLDHEGEAYKWLYSLSGWYRGSKL